MYVVHGANSNISSLKQKANFCKFVDNMRYLGYSKILF